jgi:uncharacterized RmlC-like cupin family protein
MRQSRARGKSLAHERLSFLDGWVRTAVLRGRGRLSGMTGASQQAAELRVVRPGERIADQASGAMLRESAIAASTVGAQRIWLGYVELGPGLVSAVHHHGEAESGIYIISGHARFYSGERLERPQDANAGDFVFVPPDVIHVEQNVSSSEPVRMVVARSTQANLTFNLPTPDGWQPLQGDRAS